MATGPRLAAAGVTPAPAAAPSEDWCRRGREEHSGAPRFPLFSQRKVLTRFPPRHVCGLLVQGRRERPLRESLPVLCPHDARVPGVISLRRLYILNYFLMTWSWL